VGGYAIDTGVTLLGNRFARMRALARRLGLAPAAVPFSLAVREGDDVRRYRARRFLDLVLDAGLSFAARRAAVRLLADIVRARAGMRHGASPAAVRLGDETVGAYFERLGAGGEELLARVLAPGLRAALGGDPREAARFVLMQVVWNTLGAGFWNINGGVDRLPEALARELPVRLGSRVERVWPDGPGVAVAVTIAGAPRTLRARAAILAVPGHLVPSLCPEAPAWMREPASRATFSRVASVHLGLSRAPDARDVGCAFTDPVVATGEEGVGVVELEHLRAPGRCPAGRGMVSVYFVDAARFRCLEPDDDALIAKARRVLARLHPATAEAIELAHVIRWPVGIAQFGPGRLAELTALRDRLAASSTRVDLAGDWLDGVASESALRTGEQAAARVIRRLAA
jgi:protoporphyrinogen/coproporphyrinogen III oxidase